MKKIISLLLIITLSLCLFACEEKSETIINPMVEYQSLDEINKEIGVKIVKPDFSEITNEKYFVIDKKIAEYDFTYESNDYCLRAAKKVEGDISGIYVDGKLVFENKYENAAYYGDQAKTFFFEVDEDRYNVSITGSINEEKFYETETALKEDILKNYATKDLVDLLGEYHDFYSKRATMKVSLFEKDLLLLDINWSSDASRNDEWCIVCELDEDRLVYGDDDVFHFVTTDDENNLINDVVPGYFEIKDDGIYWSGSNNDTTNQCHFVKLMFDPKA